MNFEILSAVYVCPNETAILAHTTIGSVAIQLPPEVENVVGGHAAYLRWVEKGNAPEPFQE
jgi:hypothetical protein